MKHKEIVEWIPPNMSNKLYNQIKSKIEFMFWFQDIKRQVELATLKEVREEYNKYGVIMNENFGTWIESEIKELEKK